MAPRVKASSQPPTFKQDESFASQTAKLVVEDPARVGTSDVPVVSDKEVVSR